MAVFDAFRFVGLIGPRPLLMIAGREAVTSWMSIHAFQNATGPKELHWIDGASHNEPFSSCDLADLKDMDGLGQLPGTPGAAAKFAQDLPVLGLGL